MTDSNNEPCQQIDAFGPDTLARLADFINEAGMLRKTPRTGYQFLGSGKENVAEHSFRVALIGYVLATMAGADPMRTLFLCLVHDFHEARTGDFNYVNYLYNSSKPRQAMHDACKGTGLEGELMAAWDEQDREQTLEARLAHDADQLDLIFNLVQEEALGNAYASKWLASASERLITEEGRALARTASVTDPTRWWFMAPSSEWWVTRQQK